MILLSINRIETAKHQVGFLHTYVRVETTSNFCFLRIMDSHGSLMKPNYFVFVYVKYLLTMPLPLQVFVSCQSYSGKLVQTTRKQPAKLHAEAPSEFREVCDLQVRKQRNLQILISNVTEVLLKT